MNLAQLVPTLEVCQSLRKAGFPQDTAMVWVPPDALQDGSHPFVYNRDEVEMWEVGMLCAAPTAGELEEWLRARKPHASMTITPCNGDVPTINVDVDDDVVGLHKGVGQHLTLVSALAALVLEVAG